MNILSTQYTLRNKSFEIYLSGCCGNPHCKGCHNPLSWNFDIGTLYDDKYKENISNKILFFNDMIDNIMIFGGEPLDQNLSELEKMLYDLKKLNKQIWLFTRYDINEVPNFVKNLCDYIKCGRYIEELRCNNNTMYGIELATSNQKIYKKGVDYL